MFKWFGRKIRHYIVDIICHYVVIGGNCGCCGKWINDCVVPSYWRISICEKCIDESIT